jgi:A/G-specific adenine glycosylase
MVAASAKLQKPSAASLLAWYDAHRRDLPWRAKPGASADPYNVWLSEIMLQQTTVAAVKPYFTAFLARWPTVERLAAAPVDEVMKAWAGLGYYARARNLHACARLIASDFGGCFPQDEAELLRLPGVGPYTAAAVAAIAFNAPTVAVDGNVERVVARLFAIPTPTHLAKAEIKQKTLGFLSCARSGDFAQALMDLGATICTPRAPLCGSCPFQKSCAALRGGAAEAFPVKLPRSAKPKRKGAVFVLRCGDRVLLRQRAPKGLLGGMAAFPATPFAQDFDMRSARAYAPLTARWRATPGVVDHVFTHFSLELAVFSAHVAPPAPLVENCRWALARGLGKEGLPTLMRKVAVHAGLMQD